MSSSVRDTGADSLPLLRTAAIMSDNTRQQRSHSSSSRVLRQRCNNAQQSSSHGAGVIYSKSIANSSKASAPPPLSTHSPQQHAQAATAAHTTACQAASTGATCTGDSCNCVTHAGTTGHAAASSATLLPSVATLSTRSEMHPETMVNADTAASMQHKADEQSGADSRQPHTVVPTHSHSVQLNNPTAAHHPTAAVYTPLTTDTTPTVTAAPATHYAANSTASPPANSLYKRALQSLTLLKSLQSARHALHSLRVFYQTLLQWSGMASRSSSIRSLLASIASLTLRYYHVAAAICYRHSFTLLRHLYSIRSIRSILSYWPPLVRWFLHSPLLPLLSRFCSELYAVLRITLSLSASSSRFHSWRLLLLACYRYLSFALLSISSAVYLHSRYLASIQLPRSVIPQLYTPAIICNMQHIKAPSAAWLNVKTVLATVVGVATVAAGYAVYQLHDQLQDELNNTAAGDTGTSNDNHSHTPHSSTSRPASNASRYSPDTLFSLSPLMPSALNSSLTTDNSSYHTHMNHITAAAASHSFNDTTSNINSSFNSPSVVGHSAVSHPSPAGGNTHTFTCLPSTHAGSAPLTLSLSYSNAVIPTDAPTMHSSFTSAAHTTIMLSPLRPTHASSTSLPTSHTRGQPSLSPLSAQSYDGTAIGYRYDGNEPIDSSACNSASVSSSPARSMQLLQQIKSRQAVLQQQRAGITHDPVSRQLQY